MLCKEYGEAALQSSNSHGLRGTGPVVPLERPAMITMVRRHAVTSGATDSGLFDFDTNPYKQLALSNYKIREYFSQLAELNQATRNRIKPVDALSTF